MPVDTSIYANAVPQTINPLATLGQVAGVQNAQNQNRLFNQEFASRKAYGDIIQQATDPQTGQTDFNRANALAAQNPATAFKAPEYAAEALQRQQAQTTLSKEQLDNANTHFQTMADMFGSLAQKPDLSPKDFISMGGDLIAQGRSKPEDVIAVLKNLPANATPQQLQQVAKQFQLQSLHGAERVQAMYGTPTLVDNGQVKQFVAPSAFTGTTTAISAPILNKLGPEGKAARVGVFAGGQPGTTNQGSLVDDYGNAQGPSGGALGTGRYPGTGGAPGTPAGFVASGPKLGAAPAADVTATASAQQGVNLQQTADQVPQRKALLGNLEGALNNFTSGPGADWKKVGKALVNSNNPFGNIFDPKSLASQEEFGKQATQLAQSQFQALGGTGTDAKLDSAMHTSPNDALTPMGNRGIINMLKGNEDAISVKNQEWQAYLKNGGSPQDYGSFTTQFNKQFDPRVFQSVYMSPSERQDLLKGLDKTEKAQFQNTYNYAVSRGWIPDPRTQNGGQ